MEPVTRSISREQWEIARGHHQSIVTVWVEGRLDRRSKGLKNPVEDFMFEYYPISPNKLKTWHPGAFTLLEDVTPDDEIIHSKTVEVTDQGLGMNWGWVSESRPLIQRDLDLLKATAQRDPQHHCFGLHEWAMVLGSENRRHEDWPLRVSSQQIQKTIDEVGLRCTHFDAFRFFTDEAKPLNPLQLTRDSQVNLEQPGCLHANMDLYKLSHRWAPIVGSATVRSCFRLARRIRTLDMQGAPYDLSAMDVTPIQLETAAGRAQFAKLQKRFSGEAQSLRRVIYKQLQSALEFSDSQFERILTNQH